MNITNSVFRIWLKLFKIRKMGGAEIPVWVVSPRCPTVNTWECVWLPWWVLVPWQERKEKRGHTVTLEAFPAFDNRTSMWRVLKWAVPLNGNTADFAKSFAVLSKRFGPRQEICRWFHLTKPPSSHHWVWGCQINVAELERQVGPPSQSQDDWKEPLTNDGSFHHNL